MNQFRVERNQHGNMRIYLRTLGRGEVCVCLRQLNQQTGEWQ